jgi:transposase-like protein
MISRNPKCPKCPSAYSSKNGKRNGKQCYVCIECGYQFTLTEYELDRRESMKRIAVALYLVGLSMRTIAKLLSVNASTIMRWIKAFSIENYMKPTPKGPVIIELDEMWHFINSKKTNSGYGRLIVALPVNSLTGNVGIVVQPLSE